MAMVKATIRSHPKFKRLKRRVGEAALEYLISLWDYCAMEIGGPDLGCLDPETLEEICGWEGQSGLLYEALVEPFAGRAGWIEEIRPKYAKDPQKAEKFLQSPRTNPKGVRAEKLVVHDWSEHNSRLIANWKNGKMGGRPPKKLQGNYLEQHSHKPVGFHGFNPDETQPEPNPNPKETPKNPSTGTGTGTGTKSECVCEDARDAPAREADTGSHTPPAAGSGGVPDASDHTVGETRDPLAADPGLFTLAKEILDELNRQLGSQFPINDVTLRPIAYRLCEIQSSVGDPVGEVKKMVRREVALYADDVKRSSWLRPKTLFDERQFPNSFGARNLPVRSKKKNAAGLREAIDKSPANKESIYFRTDHTAEDKQQLKTMRAQLREIEQI